MLDWDHVRRALEGERLPALIVDAAALDRNIERVARAAAGTGKTIRLGSKSIRSRAILARVLEVGAPFRGVLSFTYDEAAWWLEGDLPPPQRDVLVAYPSVRTGGLKRFVTARRDGDAALAVIDALEHIEALERLERPIDVAIDIDVSLRRAGAHLGVRRSPLHGAEEVVRIAERAGRSVRLHVKGLLAYEAHIAGLPGQGPLQRAFRSVAFPDVARVRREVVEGLRSMGVSLALVNGGGTGSLHMTLSDPTVTEVTVGSGFLCSHLFDGASELGLEPALFVALEVGRIPDSSHVTANGGGYVASGEAGPSRLPVPALPAGMSLLSMEGAGEVQTPLTVGSADRTPRIGDPVLLRPAKAGEIAERFAEHLWLEGDRIVRRTPTYRGEGQTFL